MKDGANFYEKVDTVSATKEQLYLAAKTWIAKIFTSAKAVTELDDKDAGIIMGNAVGDYYSGANIDLVSLRYSFQITVKDGKWRLQIYDLLRFGGRAAYYPASDLAAAYREWQAKANPNRNPVKEFVSIDAKVKEIITGFELAMHEPVARDDF